LAPREYVIAEAVGEKVKIIFIDLFQQEEFNESLQQLKDN